MIGIVLVTHGRLAEELRLAMEHVVGEQRNVATLCIGPDEEIEACRVRMRESIERVDQGDGVVLLTDMFGGTPSNLAISMMSREGVEVIAGVNLPMLVKLAKVRSRHTLEECVAGAEAAGRKYIAAASHIPACARPAPPCPASCSARPAHDSPLRAARVRLRVTDGGDPDGGDAVLSRTVSVCNLRGLHARAAARFVALAERFGASVTVSRPDGGAGDEAVSARSIMGLMMLGAGRGTAIELRAEGWDAKEAIEALAALVEAGFHEQE